MGCSLPGVSVHGIFQARTLEWFAIFFSRVSSLARDQTRISHTEGRFFTVWATRKTQLYSSIQFSHSVMSDSLRSREPQHARPPCPSPAPGVHRNSCPLSQWCHPAISSSVDPSLPAPIPPSIRVFSNESILRMRWPNWSFSFNISPSNEHPGLISFRMD